MLKHLLTLAAVFLLFSCHGKVKTIDTSAEEKTKIEEQQITEIPAPYQTIESEAQAIELNKQAEAQIQEVEVQDRVFFGYDASALNDESKKILDTQVAWL